MTDWGDPGAWEHAARATAAILDALKKLRDTVSRRKTTTHAGGAESRIDALDEQIATLNNALGDVLRLMIKAQENEEKAINALFEAVNAHERRHIMALEQRPKQSRRKRVPQQKRRRATKPKRRRK